MHNRTRHPVVKAIIVCALVALTGVKIFWDLGGPPLQRWDEQGNVDVVRTTMQSGNWLTLTCKDKCSDCKPRDEAVPFLDKPPLWYWLTMLSVQLFGESATSYRLVNAIASFLLTMLLFRIGSAWFGFPAGAAAAITILTARHLFMTGDTFTTHSFRTADLDGLHLLLIMLGIYFFQRSLRGTRASGAQGTDTSFLALAALASCLAYFTKGPMGFLPVVIFMLYLAAHAVCGLVEGIRAGRSFLHSAPGALKHAAREASKTLLVLLLAAAAVILPWYVYQYMHIGRAFIDDHIAYHLVRRASEPLEGHHGSWRFYLNIFFNVKIFLMGVPAFTGLLAIATGICGRLTGTAHGERPRARWWEDFRLFSIVAGFVISFAVITAVQTKLIWYILYVYPFAALLAAVLAGFLWDYCRARRADCSRACGGE